MKTCLATQCLLNYLLKREDPGDSKHKVMTKRGQHLFLDTLSAHCGRVFETLPHTPETLTIAECSSNTSSCRRWKY